jgi:hypothetical protein
MPYDEREKPTRRGAAPDVAVNSNQTRAPVNLANCTPRFHASADWLQITFGQPDTSGRPLMLLLSGCGGLRRGDPMRGA